MKRSVLLAHKQICTPKEQSRKRCKHEHTHLKSLAVRNRCLKEIASSTNYSSKSSCPQVEE